MSARDAMLQTIKRARPAPVPLPDLSRWTRDARSAPDVVNQFIDAARDAAAVVIRTTEAALATALSEVTAGHGRHVSVLERATDGHVSHSPHSFADTDLFTCRAVLGIAENGAVWLPLSRLRYRSALFLATRVVVLLNEASLVGDFHAAYAAIALGDESYGVFVAGPSKTADIEQSLVVGAHGPKALTVVLVAP